MDDVEQTKYHITVIEDDCNEAFLTSIVRKHFCQSNREYFLKHTFYFRSLDYNMSIKKIMDFSLTDGMNASKVRSNILVINSQISSYLMLVVVLEMV